LVLVAGRVRRSFLAAVVVVLTLAPNASAATPPTPIPEGPEASSVPAFIGSSTVPRWVHQLHVPGHPFMAANGRSNIHNDAYQTDTYAWAGPRGSNMERLSTFMGGECATATFDRGGQIVSVCVGLDGPRLAMFDPQTLDLLTVFPLPPRIPSPSGGGNPFTDFSGGGYFYLDNDDRAVIPTATRHIWVIGQSTNETGPIFQLERDYDVSAAVPAGDGIISAMPDWAGRIWFVSGSGVVGIVDPETGEVKAIATGERIGNSFAVDETGGVYIVTDVAMYRFHMRPSGFPRATWRREYPNIGIKKPGQTQAGSGTTPTLLGRELVAITDNADPMNVIVYRRATHITGPRVVCAHPVFSPGAGATDQSLIGTDTSMIVENNYGYTGPTSVMNGVTTTPGFERVDINQTQDGCQTVWRNTELSAPSVVPKLSLKSGLVYTYTKPQDPNQTDAWYFTAIDFRTGELRYKRLAGTGLGFNNNFAPVTLAPDGTAYVGALGGLVMLRDR
jgi:hypothetical protein